MRLRLPWKFTSFPTIIKLDMVVSDIRAAYFMCIPNFWVKKSQRLSEKRSNRPNGLFPQKISITGPSSFRRPSCSEAAVHQPGSIRTTVRLLLIVASITCTPFRPRIWTRYILGILPNNATQCPLYLLFNVRRHSSDGFSHFVLLSLCVCLGVCAGEKQISSDPKKCAKLRAICFGN